MKQNPEIFFLIGLMLISASLFGQNTDYEVYSKTEIRNADRAEVSISMFAGEMNLQGNKQKELMFGEFLYDDPVYGKPVRSYREDKGVAYLGIESDDIIDLDMDDDEECIWNMRVNNKIPIELKINMAAGLANIDLEGTTLEKFDYALKAGEAHINLKNTSVSRIRFKAIAGEAHFDLSGDRKNDLEAHMKGGVGNLYILLPRDSNLEIDITGLIGEINVDGLSKKNGYYIRKTDPEDPTLRIDITAGIGNIYLKLAE